MAEEEKDENILNDGQNSMELDSAVLENNLSRIAYTLDRDYLCHLNDYGVLKFKNYCDERNITYTETGSLNYMAIKVTGFIINKEEKVIDCMKNVIGAFSNSLDSLGFVMHRMQSSVDLYFIFKKDGEVTPEYVNDKRKLLENSFLGNFPGSSIGKIEDDAEIRETFKFLDDAKYISLLSAVPSDKSEDYISQGIEKLLNGVVPTKGEEEYAVLVLAESLTQEKVREIISGFEEMATAITPYASHQFQAGKNNSESNGEMKSTTDTTGVSHAITKTHSVNIGLNAGRGTTSTSGINDAVTDSESDTTSEGETDAEQTSEQDTEGTQESEMTGSNEAKTKGSEDSLGGSVFGSARTDASVKLFGTGVSASITAGASADYHHSWSRSTTVGTSTAKTVGKNIAKTVGKSLSKSIVKSTAKTVGKAVMSGTFSSISKMLSFGISGGYGYSWGKIDTDSESKSLTDGTNHNVTLGSSENTTYTYKSYQVNDLLQNIEANIKRLTESKATGLWKTATYVLSQDGDTASRVANYLRGLTQGDESYIESAAVQQWKREIDSATGKEKRNTPFPEIKNYLYHFTHPVFLNRADIDFNMANKVAILESLKEELEKDTELDENTKEEAFKEIASSEPGDVPSVPITPTTNISTTELAKIFSLPTHSLPGLPVLECAEFGRNVASYDGRQAGEKKGTLELGRIFHMHREESLPVELDVRSLASHTFVTGSTGAGKSNTVYQLLSSLKAKEVKFLVVEPAKGEYKDVFGGNGGVTVYGTNPSLSPLLRINPFSFPHGDKDPSKNIHILEHLDRLVEIFNVCWPMYAAMPAVLKEAVEKSYEDCGWNLTESTNEYGDDLYPTFADVTRNIRTIIDSSEYDAENKGAYKGSLITRLKSLTNGINGLIFSTDEITAEKLFEENVIVDLSRVGSSETKSLIMGLLVLKLQEHRMTTGDQMNANLRHVTVLEEAHNLLKRTSTEQPVDGGNLLGKSVEMLTNAIAEMRTYGEGFIIADQAPNLLDMAVIRNTNTKIIMRLPDQGDRELVGRAAALNDDQIAELAKLPCGVAAVYQNDWVQPVLCKVEKYEDGEKYSSPSLPMPKAEDTLALRINIAKELCAIPTKTMVLEDLKDRRLHLGGSVFVLAKRYEESSRRKPDFNKLSTLVAAILPEFMRTLRDSSMLHPSEVAAWEQDLEEHIGTVLIELGMQNDTDLRNNILQCILQNYILNELNKPNLLNELNPRLIGGK